MTEAIRELGGRKVGLGQPTYITAEIGINHNGDLELAKRMIDGAVRAGCDAVKFQKRTPELCVPKAQWSVERDTPWGRMKYIDYRRKVELGADAYREIDAHCRVRGIQWFASAWDEASVAFLEKFDVPVYKVASASLTDKTLLEHVKKTGKPIILSTGMSTMKEVEDSVAFCGTGNLLVAHSTSVYPCPTDLLNLRMIDTLKGRFPTVPIGYSGHESELTPTWAAVALGATFIERHVTLDRTMWGSDQSSSVDMDGLVRLVAGIRDVERALGDGVKKVYDAEIPIKRKLRRA